MIVCSRTPSQIQALKMAYRSMFGVDLDKDIGNHASNDHKKVISISLLLLSGTSFFFFFFGTWGTHRQHALIVIRVRFFFLIFFPDQHDKSMNTNTVNL